MSFFSVRMPLSCPAEMSMPSWSNCSRSNGWVTCCVVILIDDETDQGRSEVALGSDTFGQGGHQVPAVGTPPAFAAVTGDPRADLQILNHEVFVTFEGRSGWHVGQRDDDFVGDDQLGGLGPLGGAGPLLTRLTRRPGGMFKGTRRDDRPGLEPLETEDFVFELLDAILLGANDLKQLPHQGSIFCFRNLGQSQSHGPILPAAMPFVPIFLRSYEDSS